MKSNLSLAPLIAVLLLCTSAFAVEPQPSSNGALEAELTDITVSRAVLTLKVKIKNVSGKRYIDSGVYFKDFYFTDIPAKKQYFPLRNSEGIHVGGPMDGKVRGGSVTLNLLPGEQLLVWVKFPAPPESTSDVDVFVPGFLPFESVPLTR